MIRNFEVLGRKLGNGGTFIWVLLFWNQNLICLGAKASSLLNCNLCFSSGWGHSLNILHSFPQNNRQGIHQKLEQEPK